MEKNSVTLKTMEVLLDSLSKSDQNKKAAVNQQGSPNS